jgi:hypothetical protein
VEFTDNKGLGGVTQVRDETSAMISCNPGSTCRWHLNVIFVIIRTRRTRRPAVPLSHDPRVVGLGSHPEEDVGEGVAWVVYDHLPDYPRDWMARKFVDGEPSERLIASPHFIMVRDNLTLLGLTRHPRSPEDPPEVLERWCWEPDQITEPL